MCILTEDFFYESCLKWTMKFLNLENIKCLVCMGHCQLKLPAGFDVKFHY